jgi:competence protein ComEA
MVKQVALCRRPVWRMAPVFIVSTFLVFTAKAQNLPDGPGKAELERVCSACHGAEMVLGVKQDKAGWESTVDDMVSRGATGTDQELDAIVNYLATNMGKGDKSADKINVNKASAHEIETGLQLTTQEAEAIVQYRTKNGDYKDWHDLEKVDGVDAKKIEAAKDRIGL